MYRKYLFWMLLMGLFVGSVFASDRNLPGVTIISRAQWWANESLRYSTLPASKVNAILKAQQDAQIQQLQSSDDGSDNPLRNVLQQRYETLMANDYLNANFSGEESTDAYYETFNGNYLKWPISIHNNKTKIVVHHTAEDYTSLLSGWLAAVKTDLQNIYKYHTITKGRWDIGYNFIIDPFGNIYEGRAGGPGTVGAHAARNNTSSIGISLMGNFNIQKPTDAQLQALVLLSTALAKKYHIDPTAKVSYFKPTDRPPYVTTVTSYALAGHRDDGQATSCPGTNLYSLLPQIRLQVRDGLVSALLTNATTSWSTANITVLTGLHYATTGKITFTLPVSLPAVTSCTGLDTWFVVDSCVVKSGSLTLSLTRKGFVNLTTRAIKITSPIGKGKSADMVVSFPLLWSSDLTKIGASLESTYIKNNSLSLAEMDVVKITHKILLPEIKSYLSGMISVLLYDLSMNYHRREISCDGMCRLSTDGVVTKEDSVVLESYNNYLYLSSGENSMTPTKVEISAWSGWLVKITSYARASYGGTPRNSFHGTLIFKQNPVKDLSSGGVIENRFVIINRLSFSDYMRGIWETSDTDSMTKQSLVLMLAKMYALFYMNPANIHPSIPSGASYTAIDNPDMFQKYVGAWREKTSKTSPQALALIQNSVVLYSGYVPILPYFSCSAGFTWSAKDKRWWRDTPYLQSRPDFVPCFDFDGHGVGLSGKGSQYLALQWWSLEKILNYYYPGVSLTLMK